MFIGAPISTVALAFAVSALIGTWRLKALNDEMHYINDEMNQLIKRQQKELADASKTIRELQKVNNYLSKLYKNRYKHVEKDIEQLAADTAVAILNDLVDLVEREAASPHKTSIQLLEEKIMPVTTLFWAVIAFVVGASVAGVLLHIYWSTEFQDLQNEVQETEEAFKKLKKHYDHDMEIFGADKDDKRLYWGEHSCGCCCGCGCGGE